MGLCRIILNLELWIALRRLMHNFPFDCERVKEVQLRKLRRLLVYSYENYDFYRKRIDSSGLDPYKVESTQELSLLPVLTKEEYRSFTNELIERNPQKYRSYYVDATSGSTGIPLKIVRTWSERAYMLAKWIREIKLNGYKCTDRTFRVTAPHRCNERDSILQYVGLFRRTAIPWCASEEDILKAYLKAEPDFFYGFKTQVVQLATHILRVGAEIERPRMYAVGAETIDDNSRHLFQSVFGKDNYFETYGCEEMGILGFQIMGSKGLHFSHDTNVLELVDRMGRATADSGYCLITDLEIFSFPLIRYQLGDWLETYQENGIRKITAVKGRVNDCIEWEDGTIADYRYVYEIMSKLYTEVSQFRVVQETYHLIRIVTVLAPGRDTEVNRKKIESEIVDQMKKKIRSEVEYKVEFVESIPPDKSGKIRMVVSKVSRNE